VRLSLRTVLEEAGHQVREAPDGSTGLEIFQAERPDLVLCSLYMPKRDGLQTVPELKSLRPDVPVIAISRRQLGGGQPVEPGGRLGRLAPPRPAEARPGPGHP
jgi:CheY-like chemotaxis protein